MSEKAKVYFSKEISPEKVLEMYQLLGKKLEGKAAITPVKSAIRTS